MHTIVESVEPALITASSNVCKGPGRLCGIFVSAATLSPTITIYDDAGTGTSKKIVDTFIPAGAGFHKIPFRFYEGLYIVVVGAVSLTVGFQRA